MIEAKMSVALEEKVYSHVLTSHLQRGIGSIDKSLLVGLLLRIYNQAPNSKIFPQGKRKDRKTDGDEFHSYNPNERTMMDRLVAQTSTLSVGKAAACPKADLIVEIWQRKFRTSMKYV